MLSELAFIPKGISRWLSKIYMELPDRAQERTTEIMKGLEHLMYEERLR